MDRNRYLPRLARVLIAVALCGVPWSLTGCGSTSDDEFRTVTEADTEDDSETRTDQQDDAAPVPKASEAEESFASATVTDSQQNAEQSAVHPQRSATATTSAIEADGSPGSLNGAAPDSEAADSEAADSEASTTPIDVTLAELPRNDTAAEKTKPIKLLIPERTFSKEDPGTLRVSFDDLDLEKVLNVLKAPPDIVEHFPDWLAGLDGQRIRIRGFMGPAFKETDLAGFTLGRDASCFFGPELKIYHLAEVAMRDGVTTDYIYNRPFDVEGVFRIRPTVDGDDLWQLYQIEDAIVIEQ